MNFVNFVNENRLLVGRVHSIEAGGIVNVMAGCQLFKLNENEVEEITVKEYGDFIKHFGLSIGTK